MYFYTAFGLHIQSQIPLPELSVAKEGQEVDLTIEVAPIDLPTMAPTNIHRRGVMATFGKNQRDDLLLHWEGIANFQASSGKLLRIDPLITDENLLSLFTVSEALGLILFQRGDFLLHASAVRVGDEAWCFMGNPGAGKSTTAASFIKAGCPLLSDDLTAIRFDRQGVPFVIPAYPQLKIWEQTVKGLDYDTESLTPVSEGVNKFSYQPKEGFDHTPVRLKRVFFLHKARNRKYMEALSAVSIPIELLKNFPLPASLVQNDTLKLHFQQSFQIAGFADLFRKRRDKSFDALHEWVVSQTLPAADLS
ncbi:hypothetical protein CLV98_10497 [Dyadobacter jejuensis]|uniref:Hpr(Ser) kinase/phosphatase n=1 Tax=Dyadobacter jejuensis TaxID=1082580 RepID=A0A316ALV2_9BACT|nr:serine kinase [Dyadobacter jejuensis]PWJ58239.1 hypothetical protein CLV98_10497 [Dyadobacter jejuensis]